MITLNAGNRFNSDEDYNNNYLNEELIGLRNNFNLIETFSIK